MTHNQGCISKDIVLVYTSNYEPQNPQLTYKNSKKSEEAFSHKSKKPLFFAILTHFQWGGKMA